MSNQTPKEKELFINNWVKKHNNGNIGVTEHQYHQIMYEWQESPEREAYLKQKATDLTEECWRIIKKINRLEDEANNENTKLEGFLEIIKKDPEASFKIYESRVNGKLFSVSITYLKHIF